MQFDTCHASLAICWLAVTITITWILPRRAARQVNLLLLQCYLHLRWCLTSMDGCQLFWWSDVLLQSLFQSVCPLCPCRDESIWSPGQKNSHWARCSCSFRGVSISYFHVSYGQIVKCTNYSNCNGWAHLIFKATKVMIYLCCWWIKIHFPIYTLPHTQFSFVMFACPPSLVTGWKGSENALEWSKQVFIAALHCCFWHNRLYLRPPVLQLDFASSLSIL